MYRIEDHIQTAKEGEGFGNWRKYKYRVMGRDCQYPTHHTDSLKDAEQWFEKCRTYWIEQDALI